MYNFSGNSFLGNYYRPHETKSVRETSRGKSSKGTYRILDEARLKRGLPLLRTKTGGNRGDGRRMGCPQGDVGRKRHDVAQFGRKSRRPHTRSGLKAYRTAPQKRVCDAAGIKYRPPLSGHRTHESRQSAGAETGKAGRQE